jgi:hypothetical protein
MKLMKSSLGVMTVAFEPGDLARANTEQRVTLNQRVSPELFKLIQENEAAPSQSPFDRACIINGPLTDNASES